MKYLVGKQAALIGLTLFTYFAAWNRGTNLLYVMSALLGAMILLSYLLPRVSIRGVTARRSIQPVAFEGDDLDIKVTVRNRGWTRRYMLEVVDRIPAAEPHLQRPMIFVSSIPRKQEREFSFKVNCFKRGEYEVGPLTIQSSYPLGLTTVGKPMSKDLGKVLVYPKVFEIPLLPILGAAHLPETGVEAIPKAGISEEFFGVREYRHGDSLRRIHWPSTARQSQLIVKEFEIKVKTEVSIILDLHRAADVGEGKDTILEYAVKIAASLAKHVLDRGHRVQLIGYGRKPLHIPPAGGIGQFTGILEALARVKTDGVRKYSESVPLAAGLLTDGGTAFMLCSGMKQEAGEHLKGLGLLKMKRVRPIGIFFDRQTFIDSRSRSFSGRSPLEQELRILGAPVYRVKRGDNLEELFGP